MKKNVLILSLLAIINFPALNAHVFNIQKHGTLEQVIDEEMLDADDLVIKELKLTGEIDGKDLAYIRKAQGYLAQMTKIDMSEVKIIPTNDYYAQEENPYVMYAHLYYYYFADEEYSVEGGYQDGQYARPQYSYFSNDFAYMFKGMSKLEEVILPAQVKNLGAGIFEDCTNLKSFSGSGLEWKFIGSKAFSRCSNISFQIPETVERFEKYAFWLCPEMKVDLVLSKVKTIEKHAFYNSAFTSLKITSPDLETIPEYAFYCNSLTEVDLSEATSLKEIQEGAFIYNRNLTTVVLPEGLKIIGNSAFKDSKINSIDIPSSLIAIGSGSGLPYELNGDFYMCGSVIIGGNLPKDIEELVIPEGTTLMAGGSWGFTNLQKVTFPEGLKSIGKETFKNCTKLTSVTFPSSLKSIGDNAFEGCTALSQVTIPENVEIVGSNTFLNCSGLVRVRYNAINASGFRPFSNCQGIKQFYIGDKVETIPTSLCRELSQISTFQIPTTIKHVGDYAFYKCTDFKFEFDCLESVGNYAFYGCLGVTKLPNTVTKAGICAFRECTNLTNVPENLEEISDNAFYDCTGITSDLKLNVVKKIGMSAFVRCNFKVVHLPKTLKSIGRSAFSCCPVIALNITDIAAWCNVDLESSDSHPFGDSGGGHLYVNEYTVPDFEIPAEIEHIKPYTFYNVKTFETLKIHPGVKSIGQYAFGGNDNIKGVYISDLDAWCRIKFTDSNPISASGNLYLNEQPVTCVTFPSDLKEVSPCVFHRCKSLKTVILPNSIEKIGERAFSDCTSLETVFLSSSLTSIGDFAFNIYKKGDYHYLEEIYSYSEVPPTCGTNDFVYAKTLYVPKGCKEAYLAKYPWNGNKNIVEIDSDYKPVDFGDANFDGKIDSQDIYSAINMVLNKETSGIIQTTDLNGDGKIDSQDVYMIINKVLGK